MLAVLCPPHILFFGGGFNRECTRGGFCNFMHLKPISRELRRELYGRRKKGYNYILCLISAVML